LHHFRRYSRKTWLNLIGDSHFTVEHWNFVNVLALPLVYLSRKFRAIVPTQRRAEDAIPSTWLNFLLRRSFTIFACQEKIRFPIGVGLLGVLRRKA
jgi:hypothetical protein